MVDVKTKKMKTILIAEDNDFNYLLFVELLRSTKHTLIHAQNGSEAVEICKTNPNIDLILMDINMPVMNGAEAAEIIKLENPNIPIIAQTAYDTFGVVEKSKRKYFCEFTTKPFNGEDFKILVSKYCDDEK